VLAGRGFDGLARLQRFVANSRCHGRVEVFPVAAILAGVGIVVGVAYIVRAVKSVFIRTQCQANRPRTIPLEPIFNTRTIGAVIAYRASLIIGTFPGCC